MMLRYIVWQSLAFILLSGWVVDQLDNPWPDVLLIASSFIVLAIVWIFSSRSAFPGQDEKKVHSRAWLIFCAMLFLLPELYVVKIMRPLQISYRSMSLHPPTLQPASAP
jgi:hypothetical protein